MITSPTSTSFSVTRPAIGDCSVASVSPFSSDAICALTTVTRARAASISSRPGAGLEFRERFLRRPHAALRLRDAISRHIPPRRRIVALLARSGVVLEQRVEANEILLGGIELRSRGGRLRRGRFRSATAPAGRPRRARRPARAATALRLRPAPPSRAESTSCTSRVSSVSTICPGCTRSPSFTVSVRMRPPTSGARRVSVASTCPETRSRSLGASSEQAMQRVAMTTRTD